MESEMAKMRGVDITAVEAYDVEHYCACIKELVEYNRNASKEK
jgi:hypothetical protein